MHEKIPPPSGVMAPVGATERIASVDVLRGVALLGILVINIEFFALPAAMYFDPSLAGGFTGINLYTWLFGSTFFLNKMMAIFSMLFGAGIVLMYERFEARSAPLGGVYYRRVLWLLLFGLIHSYFIWYGDILVTYAICGLLLFLFRRRSAKVLMILGIATLLFGLLIQFGSGFQFRMLRSASEQVEIARAEGKAVAPYEEAMAEAWGEIEAMFKVTDEEIAAENEAYRGGYLENLAQRVPETLMMQTQALAFMMFWRVAGLMLLGMSLMKLRVFSAGRSMRFYVGIAVIGYAIGLPLTILGTNSMIAHEFDIVHRFMIGNQLNGVGSLLVALGHAGVVLAICRSGALSLLRRLLAGVGQMALTNYLMQSLICTTIFYGFGFGLFGRLDRFELLGFVLAVWLLQLVLSRWWMNRFRFGPAEWAWRLVVYWQKQPMRIADSNRAAPSGS